VSEHSIEAPETDAAEQDLDVVEHDDDGNEPGGSDEVEPADRAEQQRVVEGDDEDDYR
jgi:hypothetical protein